MTGTLQAVNFSVSLADTVLSRYYLWHIAWSAYWLYERGKAMFGRFKSSPMTAATRSLVERAFTIRYADLKLTKDQLRYFKALGKAQGIPPDKKVRYK